LLPSLNEDGSWKKLNTTKKTQCRHLTYCGSNARLLGLAQASYRQVKGITNKANLSVDGNEVAWGTIEMQVPLKDCFLKLSMQLSFTSTNDCVWMMNTESQYTLDIKLLRKIYQKF
jgi:hypothetical protein